MRQRSVRVHPAALVLAAVWPGLTAVAIDYSAPEEVYELRARDPQQSIEMPRRFLWPNWQETHRASLYGWVDCGLGANTLGGDFNGPIGPQDRNWQAMMNQLYLVGERTLDTQDGGWGWGARIDLLYGTDTWTTTARGLDAYLYNQVDNAGTPRWDSSRYYALAMPQLYAEAGVGDVSVLIGHFYTPLGYDVVPAVGNFFYSHSYTFFYGTPNTHTGVLATWEPEDGIRLTSGITNGWDNFTDGVPAVANPGYPGASSNLAYLGSFTFASADGRQLLSIAVSSGNEYTPVVDPATAPGTVLVGNRSMLTTYWITEFADRWTYVIEGSTAWQFHADTGLENSGQLPGLAQWYGICQYLYHGLSDSLSAGTRFEWFRDNNGSRVAYPGRDAATNTLPYASGFAGNFWGATLGLNWTPTPNWIMRPELRYDWYTPDGYSTGALPFGPITTRPDGLVTGSAYGQWYLGCDVIMQF
jgi:hypothetical protein